jgi:hypothetical protein
MYSTPKVCCWPVRSVAFPQGQNSSYAHVSACSCVICWNILWINFESDAFFSFVNMYVQKKININIEELLTLFIYKVLPQRNTSMLSMIAV